MSERVHKLGSFFNYSWYFEKRRSKFFNKRKKHAKELIEKLEIAIIVSVRMTGGEIGKTIDLHRMSKNQQCTVCHSSILEDEKKFTYYFRANKIDGANRPLDFNLEWTRDDRNVAEQLSETEWLSGPLILCGKCVDNIFWCETHIKLKDAEYNMHTNNFEQLPKICSLYHSLEKTLNLGMFFEEQIKALLSEPKKNIVQLVEMRNCIDNCCMGIDAVGLQISKIGYNDPTFSKTNRRELMIQRNIWQHSNEVAWKLRHLISSINSVYDKTPSDCKEPKEEEWNILNDLRRVLCIPIRRIDNMVEFACNNNSLI